MIEILPYGDEAVLVNFEQKIDPSIIHAVYDLRDRLSNLDGITYCIPAYCSLVVGYNKATFSYPSISLLLEENGKLYSPINDLKIYSSIIEIPVCYDKKFGVDLCQLSIDLKLEMEEIIAIHCDKTYLVYMMGFLPGFPYLASVDERLFTRRKNVPSPRVARGSVAIAGQQTGIYPTDSPGGWHVIGKTPINMCLDESHSIYYLNPLDVVKFIPISIEEYEKQSNLEA